MRCRFVLFVPLASFVILWLSACTAADTVLPTRAVMSDSRLLNFWQSERRTMVTADEIHTWEFVGQAGDAVRVRAVEDGSDVTMTLRQGGDILAEGNPIDATLPRAGRYQVQVQFADASAATRTGYDIGLAYTDRPRPGAATDVPQVVGVPTPTPSFGNLGTFVANVSDPGETVGRLTASTPRHVYTYSGSEGDVISLDVVRVSGTLDPVLTIVTPDGNPIATDDNSGENVNARLRNIRLPEDGTYSIQVDGKGFYGDYTLRLQQGAQDVQPDEIVLPTPTPLPTYLPPTVGALPEETRLQDHIPVTDTLPRSGDFRRFSFYADAGEQVSVLVAPQDGSPLQPQFEVFGPVGNQIVFSRSSESNAGGAALAAGVPINESGAYIVIVTGENNSQGAFTISYGRGITAQEEYAGEIIPGEPLSGTVSQHATRYVWQATFDAGDTISLAASPTGNQLDPVIEIAALDGTVLYRDDNSGANNAALIQLASFDVTNTYLVRVYDAQSTNIGGYTLLWRYVQTAPTPTPIPAAATILSTQDVVREGEYEFYAFQGEAGQQIRIEVTADPEGALDAVAALLDPSGQVIAEADDVQGLNPVLTITLPESGTYSVRVNGYLSGGNFDLRVARLF